MLILFVIPFFLTINATAIRLTVHFQFFGYLNAFLPPHAEVLIVKRYSHLLTEIISGLMDEIMFLILAV